MKIFSINTNSYEPVSFGKSYLYNQYDKIYSFITSNFGNKYKNILAKPIISENQVLWHSDSKNKMLDMSSSEKIKDLGTVSQDEISRSNISLGKKKVKKDKSSKASKESGEKKDSSKEVKQKKTGSSLF